MLGLLIFLSYLIATICGLCAVLGDAVFGHPALPLSVTFIALGLLLSALPVVLVVARRRSGE
jgi:hypothetical protein